MRKFLVKLFNLIYLAGAGLSIFSLVTKPMINTEVGVSLTSDQVADRLIQIFESNSGSSEGGEGGSTEASSYKLTYRDSSSEKKVTREDIKAAFPDGFSLKVGIKIEAKDAFNLKDKTLLTKSIAKSLEESINNVLGKVTTSLHTLIKNITEKLAKEELKNQIQAQINQYFEGASPVTDEEVQAVYDNIYNSLSGDEPVTVENLANTIVGEKDESGNYPEGSLLYLLEEKKKETGTGVVYAVADPKPTQEQVEEDLAKEESERIYYVQVPDDDPETPDVQEVKYVLASSWGLETQYYVQKYDATNVTGDDIADKLAESLSSIPGLVEDKFDSAEPTPEQFNATVKSTVHYYSPEAIAKTFLSGGVYSPTQVYYTITEIPAEEQPAASVITGEIGQAPANRHYVVKTDTGYAFPDAAEEGAVYYRVTPVAVTSEEYYNTAASTKYKIQTGENAYEFAKIYDAEAHYFVETKVVNDVNTALSKLIEQMLGGGSSSSSEEPNKSILRGEGEGESSGSKSQEELEAALKEYLYKLLPIETIYGFTEKADAYSTYVALGVIGLLVFPWALFALVTLIRTLRRRKCWTKPWIVFVFAFIQVIFGIVLTYGTKYAMPIIAKYVPKVAEILEQTQLGVDIRTGCLIPSFVYCAFIVMTIPYIIIAHRLKVEYKFQKRAMAMQRYGGRRPRR